MRISDQRTEELKGLSAKLGYTFKDLSLLNLSLTHPSYSNENRAVTDNNQRLEFLGDSVLGLVISEHVFANNKADEGELTNAKIKLVQAGTLTERATDLNLGEYLLLGKGETQSGGRFKPSVLEDALESVLGAVFLDGGYDAAKVAILQLFEDLLKDLSPDHLAKRDFKSYLQEMVQARKLPTPTYKTLSQEGSAHSPVFIVALSIADEQIATGEGSSKKAAEQAAALKAIDDMEKDR